MIIILNIEISILILIIMLFGLNYIAHHYNII